jgi:predicted phosphoribosyltransferase
MGAIAGVGEDVEVIRNERVLGRARISAEAFEEVRRRETAELHRRECTYRSTGVRAPVTERTVVVVDDGVATGSTMLAALAAVRSREPGRLVVAIPVAASASVEELRAAADDVVCGWTPEPFYAVGQGYLDFAEVPDDDVRRLLGARGNGARS